MYLFYFPPLLPPGLATGNDKKAVAKHVVKFMKPNAEMAGSSAGPDTGTGPNTVMAGPMLVAADAKCAHLIQGEGGGGRRGGREGREGKGKGREGGLLTCLSIRQAPSVSTARDQLQEALGEP